MTWPVCSTLREGAVVGLEAGVADSATTVVAATVTRESWDRLGCHSIVAVAVAAVA